MRSRSDVSLEHELARTLADIERALEERKAAPQQVGTYNIRHLLVENEGTHDWTGTLPSSPQAADTGTKVLRITVTAKNMDDLFCRLAPKMFVGSLSNWYRPSDALADPLNAFTFEFYPELIFTPPRNEKAFICRLDGDDTTTVWFKVYVISNDDVDITITEVN